LNALMDRLEELHRVIGNTPVVRLRSFSGDGVSVWLKLEYTNPGGSHKDRAALYMISRAVEEGVLKPGGSIVEVSSGNTAISLAWIGRRLGLDVYIVVDARVSKSKVALLKALGARVEVTPVVPPDHPMFKRNVALRIAKERNAVFLDQDNNEANHLAHYETTGAEIAAQVRSVKAFVMGIGTGGTVTGVGRRLKEELGSSVRVIGVAPRGSPLDREGGPQSYIEGLVSSKEPGLYEKFGMYVDELIAVSEEEALDALRRLVREEGIPAGLSTGAALAAIEKLRRRGVLEGDVVTIAADSLLRYQHLLEKLGA